MAQGIANPDGFQPLAESEPSEDSIRLDSHVVARGVAVNSIN
jgi:hypothetical protein